MSVILLFVFETIWLNIILISLLTWLLVAVLIYQRNTLPVITLYRLLIFPAFMIFGERRSAAQQKKSSSEIARFNAYLEESTVLQQLQTTLKKRLGIDLQQLPQLKTAIQQITDNYTHQSRYIDTLSQQLQQHTPQQSKDSTIVATASETQESTTHDADTQLQMLETVVRQMKLHINRKIEQIQQEQGDMQQQFEQEIDTLSGAIENAVSSAAALQLVQQQIEELRSAIQQIQTSLHYSTAKASHLPSNTTADTIVAKERDKVIKNNKKENFDLVNKNYKNVIKDTAEDLAPEIVADTNFTDYKGELCFTTPPADEFFTPDNLVDEFTLKVTPYAIKRSIRNETMAFYHLVEQPENIRYAQQNAESIVHTAMLVVGKGSLKAANRITLKAGELTRVGDRWRIAKRAVLYFE